MLDTPFALQFWPSFVSTVIGGFAISAIFFWLKEHLFSLPSLTGVWECHLVVGESAYNPYKGMELWHRIVLLQEGTKLTGRGEKYKDWAANHPVRTYDGKHRVESQITGGIEKSVTKSDVIRIHWSEAGELRTSSTLCELLVSGSKATGNLSGKFYSTAGECNGHASWTRITRN